MNTIKTILPGRILLLGAGFGAIAWLCYGGAELWPLAILPRLAQPAYEYKTYDPRFSALLLVLYAAFGAAVGIAAALLAARLKRFSDRDPADVLRPAGTLVLSGMLLANLLILYRESPFSPTILVANLILVITAALESMGNGVWARRCRPFAAAWLPCATYLGSQWLAEWLNSEAPAWRVTVYGILLIAAFWVLAWVAGRKENRKSSSFPARALAAALGFAFASCGVTAVLQQAVYTAPQDNPPAAATGRPNIILISLDTVRADHLSVYGYQRDTTPHLKHFAREAVVYTHAIAAGDMTLPSHASMFTGVYPSQHGAHFSPEHRMGAPLGSRWPTLAGRLRNAGFWTAGVIANSGYLSITFGLDRGFAYWDQRQPPAVLAPVPPYYLRGRIRDLAVRFLPTSGLDRVSRSAEEINAAALDALQQRPHDGRPFFLFLNYMDAHIPYIPPAPYSTMFPGRDPGFTEHQYMTTYLDVIAHDHKISDRVHAHLISQYDGGIAYLDAQLAALFGRLKATGLYDNSMIVVTADHGEALGERNCMDHGGMSLYREQIHVPLLIRFPNGPANSTVDQAVSGVDLLPTVLTVSGLSVPKNLPGRTLTQPVPDGREVISESFPGGRAYYTNTARFDRSYRSIVSSSLQYIVPSAGKPELYDLRQDPTESANLYNPNDSRSQDIAEQMVAWSRTVAKESRGPVKLNHDAMERLRSLGYVGQ